MLKYYLIGSLMIQVSCILGAVSTKSKKEKKKKKKIYFNTSLTAMHA